MGICMYIHICVIVYTEHAHLGFLGRVGFDALNVSEASGQPPTLNCRRLRNTLIRICMCVCRYIYMYMYIYRYALLSPSTVQRIWHT